MMHNLFLLVLNNIFDIDYSEAYWWYDNNDVFCTNKKYDTITTKFLEYRRRGYNEL